MHAAQIVLTDGMAIESSTSGANGADIILDTATLNISNGAFVHTITSGPGNAGDVIVPRGQTIMTGVAGTFPAFFTRFSGIDTATGWGGLKTAGLGKIAELFPPSKAS